MTYLARLVARARGELPGGLRPRQPSRFEPRDVPAGTGPLRAPDEAPVADGPGGAAAPSPTTPVAAPRPMRPSFHDVAAADGPGRGGSATADVVSPTVGGAPPAAIEPGAPADAPARAMGAAGATGPKSVELQEAGGGLRTTSPSPGTVASSRSAAGSPATTPPARHAVAAEPSALRGTGVLSALPPDEGALRRSTNPPATGIAALVVFADAATAGRAGGGTVPAAGPLAEAVGGGSAQEAPNPPARRNGSSPARAATPATIEVTIGRVEVRTTVDTPKSRPRQRRAPTIALDRYLDQRRGS